MKALVRVSGRLVVSFLFMVAFIAVSLVFWTLLGDLARWVGKVA